jgi:site-specific DNA-methyltransferase (adenine-specific)
MINLIQGNCLELMKSIPDGSIDAIITDPPYGTTACKWDSVIDFKLMWEQLNRIIKPNGAIVLFGSEPFSSALRMSNIKNYKYDWIWQKNAGSNFGSVRFQPMKEHENIVIFGKGKLNYYPIRQKRADSGFARQKTPIKYNTKTEVYSNSLHNEMSIKIPKDRVPSSVQKFNRERGLHPTQKPVLLMEYLIKTYTNKNETVLDFTMGSGSTGVACVNTNRNFIGIEMDDNYFNIANERINKTESQLTML